MNNILANIQKKLKKENINFYIILKQDSHFYEYTYEKDIEKISNFTGSNATILITQDKAFLHTDGRYYLQALKQLKNTNFTLMKENYLNYIKNHLKKGNTIAINSSSTSLKLADDLINLAKDKNAKIIFLDEKLYECKNDIKIKKIFEHNIKYNDLNRKEKIALIKEKMQEKNASSHLISSLDDIAWILNLRGFDIENNMIFLSYFLILKNENILFIDKKKLDLKIIKNLEKDNIKIKSYDEFFNFLKNIKTKNILLDPKNTCLKITNLLNKNIHIIKDTNPSVFLKAQKGKKEISNIKKAMIYDGVALCEFFAFLEEKIKNKDYLDELFIDEKLKEFRAKNKNYIQDSFSTIAGFNENGAIIHYIANENNFSKIKDNGLLLIDSGAHYKNGTTDITRVIPIGKINKEFIKDYTLILKAHINISSLIFPKDIALPLIDAIARAPLWENLLDYNHGSGHGVGYCINAHEGPQSLSINNKDLINTKAKNNMILSIEPGIYKKDKYGIRLENLVQICDFKQSDFGEFMCFKTLSLCPFEPSLINTKLLSLKEKKWLNDYNKLVYKSLYNKLSKKAKIWLKKRTKTIL